MLFWTTYIFKGHFFAGTYSSRAYSSNNTISHQKVINGLLNARKITARSQPQQNVPNFIDRFVELRFVDIVLHCKRILTAVNLCRFHFKYFNLFTRVVRAHKCRTFSNQIFLFRQFAFDPIEQIIGKTKFLKYHFADIILKLAH